jgi:hypothetical protein
MEEMTNAYEIITGKPEGELSVDGRIMLKWMLKRLRCDCGFDCTGSVRDQWKVLLNMVMNLWVA